MTMNLKPLARAATATVVAAAASLVVIGPAAASTSHAPVVRATSPTPGGPAAPAGAMTGPGLVQFGAATIDFVGRLIGTGGSGA
jgi:hypothetical protein